MRSMLRSRAALTVLWLIVGSELVSNPANATTCIIPTPAEHVANTPIIFFGTAEKGLPDPSPSSPRGDGQIAVVEFKVLRAYKGVTGKTIKVRYLNDGGGNSGWGFQHGRGVLVFAHTAPSKDNGPVVAHTGYCAMIHYASRHQLHAEYWDLLAALK
jgi:hypothetical protein